MGSICLVGLAIAYGKQMVANVSIQVLSTHYSQKKNARKKETHILEEKRKARRGGRCAGERVS